ncbi:MAG: hypothetical protein QM764_21000 [Chitinophagaceae bacterium]
MPGNYRNECLLKIETEENLNNIPVIIYSTTEHPLEIAAAEKSSASDFITKPVKFEETVQCLRTAIERFVPHNIAIRMQDDPMNNQNQLWTLVNYEVELTSDQVLIHLFWSNLTHVYFDCQERCGST